MFDFSEVFCGYTKPQVALNCSCLVTEICIINFEVQRTAIFVAKIGNIMCKGAAHRDIRNIAVRCTFKTRKIYLCYKYCGALHLFDEHNCGHLPFS